MEAAENEAVNETAAETENTENTVTETEESENTGEKILPDLKALAAAAAKSMLAKSVAERFENAEREVAESYPSFNAREELKNNPVFANLMKAGADMRSAYEAANIGAIINAAVKYGARAAEERMTQALKEGGRVGENAVMNRAGSVKKRDISALGSKEILKLIKAAENGERIEL